MLVYQLINELKKYPRNALLLIDGYEGGYQDPEAIGIHKVFIDPDFVDSDYFGKYEKYEVHSDEGILAVIIERSDDKNG